MLSNVRGSNPFLNWNINLPNWNKYIQLNYNILRFLNIGSVWASKDSLAIICTALFWSMKIRFKLDGYVDPQTLTQHCKYGYRREAASVSACLCCFSACTNLCRCFCMVSRFSTKISSALAPRESSISFESKGLSRSLPVFLSLVNRL